MANLSFQFLYRDASNYKVYGELVLPGLPVDLAAFGAALEATLRDGQFFIPGQVSVDAIYPWGAGEPGSDDHCFHEFDRIEETDAAPTDSRSPEVFLGDFNRASADGWREFDVHFVAA